MLQTLEYKPEVAAVEGSLQTIGDLGMLAVVGQRTGKLVSPSLAALRLANLTELCDARSHRTHIVQRVAYHVRHIGNCSLTCGLIETLQRHITIHDGSLHYIDIALVYHIINSGKGIENLC